MLTFDQDLALLTDYPDSEVETEAALTAGDFEALDHFYSERVRALTSKGSLLQQGCAAVDVAEILEILASDPEVFSDTKNGHCVGSFDIEADLESLPIELSADPLQELEESTTSCLHRYASANDLFVADNAAWVKGFNPAAFERHVERTRKARRYHGIEDIVFDKAGRVRSVRKLIKRAA
jgi:hypothetical protein